ncbi:uncharacterized protein LOC114717243 [Neltuma alba]|uniref:uncharacterized protein LOC114717243 n=1 Tax=Neltuma alba TaxID=207710 RepID=UPI0010A4C406|nr:uncharacterized protein LOC114717243 [Prosopis alba]
MKVFVSSSNGVSLFLVSVLVLLSVSSISALSSSGSIRHPVKFILGEENLGPWKNEVAQAALAPVPESHSPEDTLILAANRTKRPDILRGFRRYRDGWDISNNHYWAIRNGFL